MSACSAVGSPGLAARQRRKISSAARWRSSGDAILRAVAAWQYGQAGAQAATNGKAAVPLLVAALGDPYSAVRYVAGHALARIDPAARFDYLAPVDGDTLSVPIAADEVVTLRLG